MKLRIVLWILPFVVHATSLAAGGSIAGRVTGKSDSEPLVGVNVLLRGTVRGTTTDSRGKFLIRDVAAGNHSLSFSMVGYQQQTHIASVTDGAETFLSITMVETPLQTEQIVITASKREQSLEEVPVSISVLDATEIQQRNSLTIDDALRFVPGVNLTGPQINIRGSSGYSLGAGSRVLMLLDGMPFISGDTGELIFEAIPVGQVDRIEIVKGASSALYGSNALGGVVNVITKPIGGTEETSIRTYGGVYARPTFDQWKWSDKSRYFNGQSISHSRMIGDIGASLFLSRQLDDGFRQNDYRRRYNIFLKTRIPFSASTALTLNAGVLHQYSGQFLYWRSLDSATIPPLKHETDNLKSTRYYVNSLFSTVVTDNLLFTGKMLYTRSTWGFQQTGDVRRTESVIDGLRLDASGRLILGDLHTLTFGLDGNIDMIGGEMFAGRTIGGFALYAQDEMTITDQCVLTIGARTDFQSVGLAKEARQINPKAALAFSPWKGTTVRTSFGKGFRVPSVAEAFIAAGGGFVKGVPNVNLKPERSSSYELGITRTLSDIGVFDLAVFRSDFDNLIEPGLMVSGQNLEVQWRNVTEARVQGFETSLKLMLFGSGFSCTVGYTYVYPEDRTKHDLLKYRPRHLLYTNVLGRIGWLSAGADFRFVSRVERIDNELVETGIVPDGDERQDILICDLRLGADLSLAGSALNATVNIRNAFQRNYIELIGNLMPPRSYTLTLEARL